MRGARECAGALSKPNPLPGSRNKTNEVDLDENVVWEDQAAALKAMEVVLRKLAVRQVIVLSMDEWRCLPLV